MSMKKLYFAKRIYFPNRMIYLLGVIFSIKSVLMCDTKSYVNVTGDFVLGALFPIHRKRSDGNDCGVIQLEDGIQPIEAMLYAVERINQDPNILPGIRLGVIAFDSCDNPRIALERTLNFVKGFIAHANEYHKSDFQCKDGNVPKFLGGSFDKIIAIIAAQSSSVTLQVASMLRLFSVPQISYMATTPVLSNKERFPHFFRTVPSDINQARAMLELLSRFDWTYVSVVYSDTEYGNHGYETLVSLANEYSICFSAPQRIRKERFSLEDYNNVILTIANKTEVRVVVLFAEKITSLRVLDAAMRLGLGTRYVWVGSDAWSTSNRRATLNRGDRENRETVVLEGALSIQPLSKRMSGFDEYFTALGLEHQNVNPWFSEFWREYHDCDKKVDNYSYFVKNHTKSLRCSDSSLKISPETGYSQQKFLHFVRDAVYAVARALHNLQIEKCGKVYKGTCSEMAHVDGDTLIKYLSTVSFRDVAGNKFTFINGIDGPPRYSILNYQKGTDGLYHWYVIGNYTHSDSGAAILHLEPTMLKYRDRENGGRRSFPNSTCAQPCLLHQVKIREKTDLCCWRCRNCGLYQYKMDDHKCEDCAWGTKPTDDRQTCVPIPEEFIDYSSLWAICAMVVATCGVLLTIFVLFIFWTYRNTPIIKASGRELSALLLLSILTSFVMTFAIVAKPDTKICAVTRFGIGFCYTLCYSALVTKTNRIHRIFNNSSYNPHKPCRYTSPKSQFIITFILITVEIVINSVWLSKVPPTIVYTFPTRNTRLRICRGFDDRSYMIGLIYPFLLIVACTIYAIKTRKCPEGFNETRHIAFTNYTTLILWLAFVPLYLASSNNAIKAVTLALSLSLSALVQLACLFLPKIYIVLLKPQRNTKELVMAQHHSTAYLPSNR